MSNYIERNLDHDGVDRRGFLKCMAWAGTGTLCVLKGGVLKSFALSDVLQQKIGNMKGDLSFVQISDSHIGFNKDANPYLKRFGSVTVLNGHIHQTMQKVEGNITFHTACSTAFPQPQPGKADSPGPMKVPAEKLRDLLGITDVNFVRGKHTLGITDSTLA